MTHPPPTTPTLDPDPPTPISPPSRDALNRELVRRHQAGDREATAELCLRNANLVWTLANRQTRDEAARRDFFQAGMIGLMRAADKFDHGAGTVFASYAGMWIRARMQAARRDMGPCPILIPYGMQPGSGKRRKAKARDIAAADRALAMRAAVGMVNGLPYIEIVPDESEGSRHDLAAQQADERARDGVFAALLVSNLPAGFREIVVARFGLGGGVPLTFKEIGRHVAGSGETMARERYLRAIAMLQEMVGVEPKPRKRRKPGKED